MIVVDASAMVEVLVGGDADPALLDELAGDIAAPHVLDLEVLSVLRGLTLTGKLAPETADRAPARVLPAEYSAPQHGAARRTHLAAPSPVHRL